ncbi:type I inositol polyphosphate 5-phosphatase 10 isoform X2 [Asparagus officinalis]|uniref:type I inositol polyphosphate 5-phosphatase 10 isoform X2 n=1 Tax=Asparagus officinalis TaxID=4686 RepID=UPI00098DF01F|nr:type I inositol polyphosphate 5-phosphatase 10 isoform X2 [Asparagus officinalis]
MSFELGNKRKKSLFPRICGMKEKKETKENETVTSYSVEVSEIPDFSETSPTLRKSFSADSTSRIENLCFDDFSSSITKNLDSQAFRIFAATWNVGGNPPRFGLNLNDFLPVDDQSDIYVLGFQEIVPLNAGNVLVLEDNQPAAKWLALISQALNGSPVARTISCPNTPLQNPNASSPFSKPYLLSKDPSPSNSILFFHKPSLKSVSKSFKTDQGRQLKVCNCPSEVTKKYYRYSCFRCPQPYIDDDSSEEDEESNSFMVENITAETSTDQMKYSLVACKQMVGIFVTVWVRREIVRHIGHLRISCIGRGVLGYLGNKGCISVSMSLHQTSFCFVCSHLASGEKEGDELRRNADVIEILKNTQFPKICKTPWRRNPEKILDHDRIIWLGDLNYRISLSYSETRNLLEDNNWDALFEKDQLKIERDSGRVFRGWREGKIYFAPTYKYSNNSDAYAGETATCKKKRRTPAWCDRILWHGDGITQLSYYRGESRFSDHRPVCAVFLVEVGVLDERFKKGALTPNMKVGAEELLPRSTSCSS